MNFSFCWELERWVTVWYIWIVAPWHTGTVAACWWLDRCSYGHVWRLDKRAMSISVTGCRVDLTLSHPFASGFSNENADDEAVATAVVAGGSPWFSKCLLVALLLFFFGGSLKFIGSCFLACFWYDAGRKRLREVDRVIKAVFEGESSSGGLAFTLDPAEYGSKDDPSIYQWTARLIGTLSESWLQVRGCVRVTKIRTRKMPRHLERGFGLRA